MRWRSLIGLTALAVSVPAAAVAADPSPAETAPEPEVTVTATLDLDASTPEVETEGQAVLGRAVLLEITVRASEDVEIFGPTRPATGSFRLVNERPGTRKVAGGQRTEIYRFELLPLRTGYEKVPAIEVPFRPVGSDVGGAALSPPIRVAVRGHLANSANPALQSAPDPRPVETTNWLLLWTLLVGGTLVAGSLITLFILRALRSRFIALADRPPARPANEVALERLDALERAGDDAVNGAERLATTIDILREYLGGRYGFDALEMTTPELMRQLAEQDLVGVDPGDIEGLLGHADLVKFARIVPAASQARERAPQVRTIVESTWVEPEEELEEDAVPRREPATRRQRAYAAGADIAVAGAVGLLLFVWLWLDHALELGFVAPLATGALLVFRDALGRSAGKSLLGLGVVRRDEAQGRPTPTQLVQRNLLLLVWPLTLAVEALVWRNHPLQLRLGDLWAQTEVVQGEGGRR